MDSGYCKAVRRLEMCSPEGCGYCVAAGIGRCVKHGESASWLCEQEWRSLQARLSSMSNVVAYDLMREA